MAYPDLTPLPTPPNPDSPSTFDTLAYPFTQAQVTLAAEINALVDELNATFFPATPILAMIAGTAAAPVFSRNGDTDTGQFFPAANTIAWSTGGTEKLRLTAAGLLQSSTAIVTSATDVTAGRLLTTEAGPAQAFRRGNVLGTVSQSGGIPTGSVIERGSNANGEYVRYADGTQICTAFVEHAPDSVTSYTFPAAFAFGPAMSMAGGRGGTRPGGASAGPRVRNFLRTFVVGESGSQNGWTLNSTEANSPWITGTGETVNISLTAIGRWY